MSVVIDGTTGISGNDGSAATPALRGEDANTGVFFPAADTVAVATGGSERMRVTSAGEVGIGTSSPTELVQVVGGNILIGTDSGDPFNPEARVRIQGEGNEYIQIKSDGTGTVGLLFGDTTDDFTAGVLSDQTEGNNLYFFANNIERLRIASAGQLGIGGANYGTSGQVLTSGGSGAAPSWAAAPAPTTAQVASATAGISYGAVGSYLEGGFVGRGDVLTQNSTIAGSSIKPGGAFANNTDADTVVSSGASLFGGSALSGTWRVMGRSRSSATSTVRTFTTLFLRIS